MGSERSQHFNLNKTKMGFTKKYPLKKPQMVFTELLSQ